MPPKSTESAMPAKRRSPRISEIRKRNENTSSQTTQTAGSGSTPFTGGKRKSNAASQPAKKARGEASAKPKPKPKPRTSAVAKKPTPKVGKAKAAVATKNTPKPAAKGKGRASQTKVPKKTATATKKRKAEDDEDDIGHATKKSKVVGKTSRKIAALKHPKPAKVLPEINTAPTQILDVYVFGEGPMGELGLGAGAVRLVTNVKRPRLNVRLDAVTVGIVTIAVGGMHSAAITYDNKVITWGVNDTGALGRDTGPTPDVVEIPGDDDDDDEEEPSGFNPKEVEPREVDMKHFPPGTKFVQLACTDCATFVVTAAGQVYGWGQFRNNDGAIGFRCVAPLDEDGAYKIQARPMLIPELSDVVSLATGEQHILALTNKNQVWAWGADEQGALGRRVTPKRNTKMNGFPCLRSRLVPGLSSKIVRIGCGAYHSIAVADNGDVYAWGLNQAAQCGLQSIVPGGKPLNPVEEPMLVQGLGAHRVEQVTGGGKHTIARCSDGTVLFWGGCESSQSGLDLDNLPEGIAHYEGSDAMYLTSPTVIPGINAAFVASGIDTCAIVTPGGQAFTWGFNANCQCGQGPTSSVGDKIEDPTLIDNTATRGKTLTYAGIGGQFGIVCGIPQAAAPAQPAAGNAAQAIVAPAVPAPPARNPFANLPMPPRAAPQAAAQQPIIAPAASKPVVAASPEENVAGAEQTVGIEQFVGVEKEVVQKDVGDEDVVEDTIMEETHLEDTLLPKDNVEEPVVEDRMEE